jgi:aldose 1-epimerase
MHSLALGDQLAVISTTGARLVRYAVADRDVVGDHEGFTHLSYAGALLAPWPNRVARAQWRWEGADLTLPVNETATGAALHGLVVPEEWSVDASDGRSLRLRCSLAASAGYPFPLELAATYELVEAGLVCSLTAVNSGTRPAPVGLGAHPYITAHGLVDELELTVPADRTLLTDASWRETARPAVEEVGLDFRSPRRLGDLSLDTGFTDLRADASGRVEARVGRADGSVVAVWAGRTCRWWLTFTGDGLPPPHNRRSIAIEPMTCPPDAFNSGDVDVIEPGASLRLDWGVSLR